MQFVDAWIALSSSGIFDTSARLEDYGASSEEGGAWLWLIGPAGGLGFFMWVFLRYRNTDKRHAFERETAAEVLNLRTYDQKTGEVKGVENSRIPGQNSNAPLKRLGAGTTVTEIPAPEPPPHTEVPPRTEAPPHTEEPPQ
ncbi:MAG: hypothetical protein KKF42_07575 [Actinobacteria bacterium]|nr:hypothetical protein [Actinomycetota bacterium]